VLRVTRLAPQVKLAPKLVGDSTLSPPGQYWFCAQRTQEAAAGSAWKKPLGHTGGREEGVGRGVGGWGQQMRFMFEEQAERETDRHNIATDSRLAPDNWRTQKCASTLTESRTD
jgi:hypothetical protein